MLWDLVRQSLCFMTLSRTLPFLSWYLPLFTHSCQNRLLTSLFQSDRTISFKLCLLFVMCKNRSVRHCCSRRKRFAVEQKFWSSDWNSLILSTGWMWSSVTLKFSLFIYQTSNFNHFHARPKCLLMRNFITNGKLRLSTSLYVYIYI